MKRYHIDKALGAAGVCSAAPGRCSFGDDDAHYTSMDAAIASQELYEHAFSGRWTPENSKLDVQAIFKTAEIVLKATHEYIKQEDDVPAGSVVVKIHSESDDRSYLVKSEDGKWRPIVSRDGVNYSLGVLEHSVLAMEHRGSTTYYFTEIDPKFRSKIENAMAHLDEATDNVAAELHHAWQQGRRRVGGEIEPLEKQDKAGNVVDLANTAFRDLPDHWKAENRASARNAIVAISESQQYGGDEYTHVPEIIHDDWLHRNRAPAKGQEVAYSELSGEEKSKDITVLTKALNVIRKSY